MADQNQKTVIPKVPIRTPMFDGDGMKALGNLTRTWIYFFERRLQATGGASGPFQRTLDLKDTTIGNDIADHVTVWVAGTAVLLTGVLRKAITTDLSLRVNVTVEGVKTALGTFTIPHTTAVDAVIQFDESTFSRAADFPFLAVLSWDVTASDGSMDNAGIASFTLSWQ